MKKNYSNTQKGISLKVFFILLFSLFLGSEIYSQTTVNFTSSGTWTCPTGITQITAQAYGAGGGSGRGGASNKNGSGGGGGGGFATAVIPVIAGNTYTITVGTGGAIGTTSQNGQSGTNTTATFGAVTITATGGGGGLNFANGSNGGAGGTGSVTGGGTSITTRTGGTGGTGNTGGSGGGGGCAGTTGNGGNGAITAGGTSGGGNAGAGGAGLTGNAGAGTAGNDYGGGAGGSTKSTNGVVGANGYFTLTYAIPAPSNDNCNNAIPLTVNASGTCTYTTYTNSGATASTSPSTPPAPGCASYSGGDVWFSFVVPASGEVTIDTQTGVVTDGGMAWYTGTCGALTLLECDDDDSANGLMPSITRTGMTPGTTVYVRFWEFGNDNNGTFGICASTRPVCTTPTASPTALNLTQPANGTINGTFTAASPAPSNYLVVYNTTGAVPSPVNGTTYTVGGTVGAGNTVADIDTNTTFSVTGLNPSTTYYFFVFSYNSNGCSGGPIYRLTSPATGNATTPFFYCSPAPTSVDGTGITNVTMGTINNNSGAEAGNYGNYSAMVTSHVLGSTVNFSIRFQTGTFDYNIKIWVDWNNDGDFLDAGEEVYTGLSGTTSPNTVTGSFTIPGGATFGNHRVRIGAADSATPTPCYTGSYATYEDYTINVLNPAPCSGTPVAGTVTVSPNTAWPAATYTVSATGYTIASNITYQWQYSTTGGAPWTNAGAATGTYANYTATAPASGLVHWQLVVTCTNSGQSATSTIGVFTTMEVSDVATGCPNIVTGGIGLNGADPAPLTCSSGSCVDLEAAYLDLGNTTSYIVEPITYNPPRAFNGLANPVSVNTDDVWSPIVNLPFDFCFYGNTYTSCLIGSNGILTFDTAGNTPGGTCGWSMYGSTAANLPVSGHGALVENSIFGVFHDINPTSAGNVGWELVTLPTGCRALVVSWYNVPMYSNDTANDYTGMMVLYENSNVIEVYVQKKRITTHSGGSAEPMWNDGNAVIGIQNATGTAATVPPGRNALDPNWTTTNEAWRFVPNGTSISTLEWFEGPTATGPVIGTTPVISVCPTTTTTYTARVTYTLCDGRTIYEDDQTTVTVSANKTWDGSSSTDWNTAANWTPSGVPNNTHGVLIPNTVNKPVVNGGVAAAACSVAIQSGATLTVNPANTLTVTNAVNIAAGGDLIVENTGSLVQINNSTNTGIGHFKRTSQPMYRLDYSYWNSPVTTASNFAVGNLTSGTNHIYRYTPTQAGANGIWSGVGTGTAMDPTFGIIARAPGNFPSTGTKQTYTTTFVGTPNNGDIIMPISKGTNANMGSTTPSGGSTVVTDADDEWNLIGNPYPSAVDISLFLTDPANTPVVDGTIYLWTHNTAPSTGITDPFYGNYVQNYTVNDYATVNNAGTVTTAPSGGTTPTRFIASGQSFFISADDAMANGTTQNVTFKNSMRVANNNANFLRTANTDADTNLSSHGAESQRVWLNLAGNGGFSQLLVGYIEGTSLGWDRGYDGEALAGNAVRFYSLGADKKLTIQSRFWPFDQTDIVPLGYKATGQGSYTIGIDHFDSAFNNQNIYLEDKKIGVIHDLKAAAYSFNSDAGVHNERFILRYTNATLGSNDVTTLENSVIIYTDNHLNVKSTLQPIKEIKVYDVLGKLLLDNTKVNANEFMAANLSPKQNALIVKVTLEDGSIVNKKVIF